MPKDTHHTIIDRGQLELPERVTVAVAELASAAREGLLALAVGTGLQVLQAMLAEDVTRWSPRPTWRRWRESWTAPTLVLPAASVKGWLRH